MDCLKLAPSEHKPGLFMPFLGLSHVICVLKRGSLNYKSRERSCNAIS